MRVHENTDLDYIKNNTAFIINENCYKKNFKPI